MAEQKLTPTQKLKLAEAEITKLKQLIFKQTEQHAQELGNRMAETANQNYTLGYDEGFRDGQATQAADKAQSYITRLLKR